MSVTAAGSAADPSPHRATCAASQPTGGSIWLTQLLRDRPERRRARGVDQDQSAAGAVGALCLSPPWREPMELRSSGFGNGTAIPRRFTCDGEDLSPPLAWANAPQGTRSFVVLCDDPDAPAGTWHHWAVYDIAADRTGLAEGAGRAGAAPGLKQAVNDFRKPGYGGPCPPRRHGPHHYRFRLLALSVDRLRVGPGPSCNEVEREARKHAISEATLIGLYER